MSIPEEAVVAAMNAAWARYGVRSDPGFLRSVLNAAAPYIGASAWDEGAVEQAKCYGMDKDTGPNPYRSAE